MAGIYGQLVKAQFENLASDISSPSTGIAYFNTGSSTVKFYDGSAWRTVVTLDNTQTLTGKTLTSPVFGTAAWFKTGAESRYYNSGDTHYVGFKAGALGADKIWVLPTADGSANQAMVTDGSGNLSWLSLTSTALNQYNVDIGDSSNVRQTTNTNLLGDIKGTYTSQAYAVTSATPGIFTATGHGFLTGDKAYVTVTQNGFTANTTYYVHKIDANTFHLSTTLANAVGAVYMASSGTTAGTINSGGLVLTSGTKGTVTNDSATAGYVGEHMVQSRVLSAATSLSTGTDVNVPGTPITLTPGDWDVRAMVGFVPASGATVVTAYTAAISTNATPGTNPPNDTIAVPTSGQVVMQGQGSGTASGGVITISIPPFLVTVAAGATLPIYLAARASFSAAGLSVFGSYSARRIR